MAVDLELNSDGVILPVQAHAGARRNGIVGAHDECLKVAVTQAPEKGKANAALAETIARELGLKKSQVSLVSGHTSSRKKFLLTAVSLDDVKARIEMCLRTS